VNNLVTVHSLSFFACPLPKSKFLSVLMNACLIIFQVAPPGGKDADIMEKLTDILGPAIR